MTYASKSDDADPGPDSQLASSRRSPVGEASPRPLTFGAVDAAYFIWSLVAGSPTPRRGSRPASPCRSSLTETKVVASRKREVREK